ncbi:MAG TPA: hypothetical protein VND19_03340 [Acetobacteraceae bacterium]|nr:hypothetical protein [Acetobacteraceae bacterium]
MTWHVQYQNHAVDHVERHPSPELAIEAACRLIDDGCDVYGIGTGSLTDSIARDQVARIYEFWARGKNRSAEFQTRSLPWISV